MMGEPNQDLSGPYSSGGGGSIFEHRVQSAFVTLMLTGSPVPTQLHCSIKAIKLQRRYEGYQIDDFIAECQNPHTGSDCKLLAQVKHSIAITKSDTEFSEVISAAWSDFNDPKKFSQETDSIVLITGPLSKIDISHVRPILDWARHSENAQEFFQKVATHHFSSDEKRSKLEVFKHHLTQSNEGIIPEDDIIWKFLKRFYLIGYDLDAESGRDLSHILAMLKLCIDEDSSPNDVWNKLVSLVEDFNPDAGTITSQTLPSDITSHFKKDLSIAKCGSIEKLKEHGDLILKGINTDISGTHIIRSHYLDQIADIVDRSNFIILTGSRGSGKSAISKQYIKEYINSDYCFCLRTEDLDQPHLDQIFTSIGIDVSLSELSARFALIPQKYLIIESLEKLLELKHRMGFCDLLEYLKGHKDWTVIASCREYAIQQICLTYLQYQGVQHNIIKIGEFTDDEFNVLLQSHQSLNTLVCYDKLNKLLHNPFMVDMAIRVLNAPDHAEVKDEGSFKIAVWNNIIRKESDRTEGMPIKRAATFINISTQRAKMMVYEIPERDFDSDVVLRLESDGLIYRNPEKGMVRPSHDVLEDWAIEGFIEHAYCENEDPHQFLKSIGSEPAILRAFRFWLHQKVNEPHEQQDIVKWCVSVIADFTIASYWRDEIIITIVSGQHVEVFLSNLKEHLLNNQFALLKRFCFLMRVACKVTNTELFQGIDENTKMLLSMLTYKPSGKCWPQIIKFIYDNKDVIDFSLMPEVPLILDDYSSMANVAKDYQPDAAREMGLLALHIFEGEKDAYHSELQNTLLKIIIRTYPSISEEFNTLLTQDVFDKTKKDRFSYVDRLEQYTLVDLESSILSRYAPDLVIKLAWQFWASQQPHLFGIHRVHLGEVEECFGLTENNITSGFYPSSGLKGPFSSLLLWHESEGLDFILELCNYCAEKYAQSQLDGTISQVDLILNDGTIHKQYCSGRLWAGYRGITVFPNLLQSALMALENWLIAKAKKEDDKTLPEILYKILINSNSVMTTSVLVSIAIGFPAKTGDIIWPLLRTPEFYELDIQRKIHEHTQKNINWHRSQWQQDAYSEIYAQERDSSNKYEWRDEDLEFLVCKLQFSSMRDKVYQIIDDYFKKYAEKGPDSESWRFRLNRTDLRKCKAVEDKENKCIRFVSTEKLSPDLEEKSQTAQKQSEEFNKIINFYLWAEQEFKGESTVNTIYQRDIASILPDMKETIELLKSSKDSDLHSKHYFGSIIKGCAILIRDHSEQLEKSDIKWCTGLLIDEISKGLKKDDPLSMALDGKAIIEVTKVLPIILKLSDDSKKEEVKTLIVETLLHTNSDFWKSVSIGIQEFLWPVDSNFANSCLNSAFKYARLLKESGNYHYDEEASLQFSQKRQEIIAQALEGAKYINPDELSLDDYYGDCLLIPFYMLPANNYEEWHGALFLRMINIIQDDIANKQHRYNAYKRAFNGTHIFEFTKILTRQLIMLPVKKQDIFIQSMLTRIIDSLVFWDDLLLFYLHESEQNGTTDRFWDLWSILSHKVLEKLSEVLPDTKYSNQEGESMIRKMLFADFPIQNPDHKKELLEILKKGKNHVLEFSKYGCTNVMIYELFTRLVFLFPSLFLTDGLLILSSNTEKNENVLSGVNTIFYLERLLHKLLIFNISPEPIYKQYYDAILILLDAMVNKGSTAAFFLRDHLLTLKKV